MDLGKYERQVFRRILRGDRYSLEIREALRAEGMRWWQEHNVYIALSQLEGHWGLVHSELETDVPNRGGRPRRRYTLTPVGEFAQMHLNLTGVGVGVSDLGADR